jgi:hypothetical protein
VTGTFSCKPTTVWQAQNDQSGFSFSIGSPGQSASSITVGIGFAGQPAASTPYGPGDVGAQGGIDVTSGTAPNIAVYAAKAGSDAGPGTYALTFTSVAVTVDAGGGETFAVTGTLDATLAPQNDAGAGTVTLHATF